MPDSQPLLTIAIPTYNRCRNLAFLLEQLAPQLRNEPRVELLISDNCSPDDTLRTVDHFVKEGLSCRILRNQQNIGADLNFLQCFDLAEGRYLWICGDDDVILPGSLATLLNHLEAREVDIVYLAPFGFIEDPGERRVANPAPRAREFTDVSAFIHAVGLRGDLALITACIVNRERILGKPHIPLTEGVGSYLPQLAWVFSALRHFERGLVVERGLYAVCEKNPSRPFDVAQIFGVNWHRMATRFLAAGSPAQNAILNDQLYSWFPTNWYAQRPSLRSTQQALPHTLMKPLYGDRLLYWLCVYPLLVLPALPAGAWLAVLRLIRMLDRVFYKLR